MGKTRQRVKQACNRCRYKKTKVSARVCNKCRADDAVCSYIQDEDHQRDKTSPVALLEAQIRQLQVTVQTLYEYIRTGHNLPMLPGRSPGNDRPLLHDIVAHVNTLSTYMERSSEELQHEVPWLSAASTMSLPQSQPETSSFLTFAATEPQLDTFVASSMQLDPMLTEYNLAQTDYESLESRFDLQEFWSFADANPAHAASLRRWL
ncbi:hypothetical protein COCMIDRAFT_108956 [Bipolaris oryzae ATCC 44560]|uniref:Zn(2)-C6 fungal-type domain-containing protein n=1 Tax=Bipolaris oryzae ATCC 44560 TaxID=930090 RepID=W6YXT9_COCMI|nr:uncharacterized protein COCMIDRAFT_108956 [Bipolaris oryzae ATCC 44560]EUC40379.1 hypothetical protein COCMIDRAFT_108956 [Bipolaris oryzae ATCC 44560]